MPPKILSAKSFRQIQQPLERRRGEVETQRTAQAKVFQVYGRIEFSGSGETTFETHFPVWFIDAPQLSFGAELGGNQILEAGNFPRVNVMVRRWATANKGGHIYYLGAEFVIVADGPTTMIATAHWQAEGTGLANPVASDAELGGTI